MSLLDDLSIIGSHHDIAQRKRNILEFIVSYYFFSIVARYIIKFTLTYTPPVIQSMDLFLWSPLITGILLGVFIASYTAFKFNQQHHILGTAAASLALGAGLIVFRMFAIFTVSLLAFVAMGWEQNEPLPVSDAFLSSFLLDIIILTVDLLLVFILVKTMFKEQEHQSH